MYYGATEPRIFTPPKRELTPMTSLGYAAIIFINTILGLTLFPWQEWLLIHALEIEGDLHGKWKFRFNTIIVLVGRQNGKTFLSLSLVDFFLYVLQVPHVLGTAQSLQKAEETWTKVAESIETNKHLSKELLQIYKANGNKRINLTGGREYKVLAPTAKSARGDTTNLLVMDELREQKDWDTWASMVPTTSQVGGLTWCISNAGEADSIVLRTLRARAHKLLGDPDGVAKELELLGEQIDVADDTLGFFEWSAHVNARVDDPDEIVLANPSLGYGEMTMDTLLSQAHTFPEAKFRTEGLCQWVTSMLQPPFPHDAWEYSLDKTSVIAPDSVLTFGVDVAEERNASSIAVVGKRPGPNESWHCDLAAYRGGTAWLVNWFRERAGSPKYGRMRVALQANGAPVSGLVSTLQGIDGLDVIEVGGRDVAGYCGRFYDAVCACSPDSDSDAAPIYHRDQPALNSAAMEAQTKQLGEAWAWDRRKSRIDVSPLMAASMAFGAAVDPSKNQQANAWLENFGPRVF